jgi:hypothetical protein
MGGNEVRTNRVLAWLLMSPRVLSETGSMQGIPLGEGNAGQVEPTEPKVSGSNPDGRVSRSACGHTSAHLDDCSSRSVTSVAPTSGIPSV